MFYTIYKTTNLINGKYYIGKHQTKDLNDGYIGSGKRLKYAITKYGIDNFHKQILHVCNTEKQMNILEKILFVPDVETNYNLCVGGKGGFGFINNNLKLQKKGYKKSKKYMIDPEKNRKNGINNYKNKIGLFSEAGRKRIIETNKLRRNAFVFNSDTFNEYKTLFKSNNSAMARSYGVSETFIRSRLKDYQLTQI